MYAQTLHDSVDRQKKDAQKKFSTWVFNKFKKNKKQFLQEERAIEADRLRRQKAESSANAKRAATAAAPPRPADARAQQSFLRSQLLEMKRQSHEMLVTTKQIAADQEEEAVKRSSLTSSNGNGNNNGDNPQDDQDEKATGSGEDNGKPEGEEEGEQATQAEADPADGDETAGNQEEEEESSEAKPAAAEAAAEAEEGTEKRGDRRGSVSDEVDRRMSHATALYEEAISALEEVLHPENRNSLPYAKTKMEPAIRTSTISLSKPPTLTVTTTKEVVVTRTRRATSTGKSVFARPESEWL